MSFELSGWLLVLTSTTSTKAVESGGSGFVTSTDI
jgi:hypothetical protein